MMSESESEAQSVTQTHKLRPLTSHATPYSLARIQCVPPIYRKKSDWHRERMDSLVDNDTHGLRWDLSASETRRLLESLFPDSALLASRKGPSNISRLLDVLRTKGVYKRSDPNQAAERWQHYPSCQNATPERDIANFLNDTVKVVERIIGKSDIQRTWHAGGATAPLKGLDVKRKPDLVLVDSTARGSLEWSDVRSIGEIKHKKATNTQKQSFIEVAGKIALLLYAQDGRHSAPCLRILGQHIIVTFFDRGGSLSTAPLDVHEDPELFLRLLLGMTTAPLPNIGFDETVLRDGEKKWVLIAWDRDTEDHDEGCPVVFLERLIFISDALHSRGTTVWSGSMKDPTRKKARRQVVVKDSWIDPLRQFTEGNILTRLNEAKIEGVPQLIHEQQVQGPHPSRPGVKINLSTHLIRTLLPPSDDREYQLRVLSRLVTQPFGESIMSFSSLAELLVAFLDYVLIHKDATELAKVLHRDISLLNLLSVLVDPSNPRRLDFLNDLAPETRERLESKIRNDIAYRGLLADWGYAVPLDLPAEPVGCTSESTPSTPTCNLPPTSPISPVSNQVPKSGDQLVPVRILGQDQNDIKRVPVSVLNDDHDIVLAMGSDPAHEDNPPSVDTNPLLRTGTWSWMAAELVVVGPGKPVFHTPSHDLESLFYVLLGISVLFDEPHRFKPETALSKCFDVYFNTFEPSTLKTTTIQSKLGWSYHILRHISPYFRPLIPLLNTLREKIILPMDFENNSFKSGSPVTHDELKKAILGTLCDLDDQSWVRKKPMNNHPPAVASQSQNESDPPDTDSDSSEDGQPAGTAPWMPRPPTIRSISGLMSGTSSGGTRRPLSGDDADYPDPDYRAAKRSRPHPSPSWLHVARPGPVTRQFAATAPQLEARCKRT